MYDREFRPISWAGGSRVRSPHLLKYSLAIIGNKQVYLASRYDEMDCHLDSRLLRL